MCIKGKCMIGVTYERKTPNKISCVTKELSLENSFIGLQVVFIYRKI